MKKGGELNRDEFEQLRRIVTWKAESTYDSSFGVPRESYIGQRLRWAVRDELRSQRYWSRARHAFMLALSPSGQVRMDERWVTPQELTAEYDTHTSAALSNAFKYLKPQEGIVLTYYAIGYAQDEIARAMGVSEARISKIKYNGLAMLKRVFGIAPRVVPKRNRCRAGESTTAALAVDGPA